MSVWSSWNRRSRAAVAWAAACLLVLPGAARADVLAGVVSTKVRSGVTAAQAVVYAEPVGGNAPAAPPKSYAITQKGKTFTPRVLGVPVGATVRFPNDDDIFHNVFSLSPSHAFDLGLYRAGASKSRTFTAPGVVRVFCNIHPQMTALVVAVPTPWITTAAPDGAWRLELPAGRYRVTAMSERASPVTVEVAVSGSATAALALDESAFVAVPHTNKFGRPYPEAAYKQP
jgi:plastocyanin